MWENNYPQIRGKSTAAWKNGTMQKHDNVSIAFLILYCSWSKNLNKQKKP
jgi:hypothetical protein